MEATSNDTASTTVSSPPLQRVARHEASIPMTATTSNNSSLPMLPRLSMSPDSIQLANSLADGHGISNASYSVPPTSRAVWHTYEACRVFNEMATIIAVQVLALEFVLKLDDCVARMGPSAALRNTIRSMDVLDTAMRQLYHCANSIAVSLFQQLNGSEQQAHYWQLSMFQHLNRQRQCRRSGVTFSHAGRKNRPTSSCQSHSLLLNRDYMSLLCTANVLTDNDRSHKQSHLHLHHGLAPATTSKEDYEAAQRSIETFLQANLLNSYFSDGPRSSEDASAATTFTRIFPAAHIAYCNGEKGIAFELWEKSPTDIDMFGRTFVDLLVLAGDAKSLSDMANLEQGQGLLETPLTNSLGLQPLDTIVVLDDELCFMVLHDHQMRGRNYGDLLSLAATSDSLSTFKHIVEKWRLGYFLFSESHWRSTAHTAVEAGSLSIVRHMVDKTLIAAPYSRLVATSIQHNQEEIARYFLQGLRRQTWHYPQEIQELVRQADQQGLKELAIELRSLSMILPTKEDALQDLNSIEFGPSSDNSDRWSHGMESHDASNMELTHSSGMLPYEYISSEDGISFSQLSTDSAGPTCPDMLSYPYNPPMDTMFSI
ncbi:hypothetical protein PMZ80_008565 [Knufia obscura]|uniref:Uncharacterized protein n=1 Tax=Knufia obscura TaxID=1635080 RepID=A0ABR0RG67_9EURO|nr:hypothetical protein PMZ80_008565 [Knufia obscura]